MEAAGLGLAVLVELRTIAKSMKDRFACYKEIPSLFAKADNNLIRVAELADKISAILEGSIHALPKDVVDVFLNTLGAVKKSLTRANSTLTAYYSYKCTEGGVNCNGIMRTAASKGKLFLKGKGMARIMEEVEKETLNAESTLHHQLSQLSIALKTDEIEVKLKRTILESRSPSEAFRSGSNEPLLSSEFRFDFESKNTCGKFSAPEGTLTFLVFSSTNSTDVTVARGAPSPIHGISGMAGVGKTIALIGLAHDQKIKTHFVDGVLYMSIGATATEEQKQDHAHDGRGIECR